MQYMGMPPMAYMPPQAFFSPMHYSPNPALFVPNDNKSVDSSAHVYEDNEASI